MMLIGPAVALGAWPGSLTRWRQLLAQLQPTVAPIAVWPAEAIVMYIALPHFWVRPAIPFKNWWPPKECF